MFSEALDDRSSESQIGNKVTILSKVTGVRDNTPRIRFVKNLTTRKSTYVCSSP